MENEQPPVTDAAATPLDAAVTPSAPDIIDRIEAVAEKVEAAVHRIVHRTFGRDDPALPPTERIITSGDGNGQ